VATLNLNPYKPAPGNSVASVPIDNAFDAIMASVNGIDQTQFAAGRIFDPTKLIEASSVQRIADSTAGGAVASIDITSIPATFLHLLVVFYLRGDINGISTPGILTVNNDSGSNYDRESIQAGAASVSSAEQIASTSFSLCDVVGATGPANSFSPGVLFIPAYAGANHKAMLTLSGMSRTTASGGTFWEANFLHWRSTSALNRLTFSAVTSNFVAGSRVSIYGLG